MAGNDFSTALLSKIAEDLTNHLRSLAGAITLATQFHLKEHIERQPEYVAMMNGTLQYELGVVNIQNILPKLIDAFLNDIVVTVPQIQVRGERFIGGLTVEAIRSGYEEVLRLPEATYLTSKSDEIPWLSWMLQESDRIIISGFHFQRLNGRGRSGGGLMLAKGSWKIPSQYAGTNSDNFITRACSDAGEAIAESLRRIIWGQA